MAASVAAVAVATATSASKSASMFAEDLAAYGANRPASDNSHPLDGSPDASISVNSMPSAERFRARAQARTRQVTGEPSNFSVTDAYLRPSMRTLRSRTFSRPSVAEERTPSQLRQRLAKFLESRYFGILVGSVITVNVGIIILETDYTAKCVRREACIEGFTISNRVILGIYCAEMAVRIFVYRLPFFFNAWNLLDATIVGVGVVDMVLLQFLPTGVRGVGLLRLFRLLRLIRFSRLLSAFPQLLAIIRGFASAMVAMLWGFIVILLLLTVFAVLTVELVYPVAVEISDRGSLEIAEECAEELGTVWHAMLMYFQTLVAGDSWGKCAIPLIRESPLTFLLLGGALVCVQLGLTNLILSAIVQSADQAREADQEQKRYEDLEREKQDVGRLLDLIQHMDGDHSGCLSYDEFEKGYNDVEELRALFNKMEIDSKDLCWIFQMMDIDGDGTCSYGEFIEMIQKSQAQDVRVQMMLIKLQLSQLSERFKKQLETISTKVRQAVEVQLAEGELVFVPNAHFNSEETGPLCANPDVRGVSTRSLDDSVSKAQLLNDAPSHALSGVWRALPKTPTQIRPPAPLGDQGSAPPGLWEAAASCVNIASSPVRERAGVGGSTVTSSCSAPGAKGAPDGGAVGQSGGAEDDLRMRAAPSSTMGAKTPVSARQSAAEQATKMTPAIPVEPRHSVLV